MGITKHIPELGKIYGQWTIISKEIKRHSNKKDRTSYFHVKCNCGKEGWRAAHTLENGKTKACKSCCKSPNNINSFVLSYFNRVKRRALISKFEFNLTVKYLEDLFIKQESKCALSNLIIEFRPNYLKNEQSASLDRIDNDKGYVEGNVQWVHKDINFMKGVLSTKKFIKLCTLVSSKCG